MAVATLRISILNDGNIIVLTISVAFESVHWKFMVCVCSVHQWHAQTIDFLCTLMDCSYMDIYFLSLPPLADEPSAEGVPVLGGQG